MNGQTRDIIRNYKRSQRIERQNDQKIYNEITRNLKMTKNEIKITEKQRLVLINIAENEYTESNGAIPETYEQVSGVWLGNVMCGPVECPTGPSLGGVISALRNKGFIGTMVLKGKNKRESQIWLTEEGFKAYKTFNRK